MRNVILLVGELARMSDKQLEDRGISPLRVNSATLELEEQFGESFPSIVRKVRLNTFVAAS